MTSPRRPLAVLAVLAAWAGGLGAQGTQEAQHFDHYRHRQVFPSCTTCHQEPATGEGPLYPDSAACATCHDGTVRPRVTWHPPAPRRTNLRFDHSLVPLMIPQGQTEPPTCTVCHSEEGAPWMAVERVSFGRCLNCHGVRTAHLAAPDTACAVCHLTLPQAKDLTREDVAAFPTPPSHQEPGWVGGHGHGGRATQSVGTCAVCHAREFCLTCHVDAAERPPIQQLESDSRATAIVAHVQAPASHRQGTFVTHHGGAARRAPLECATCHAQESCLTCHVGTPRVAARIPRRGPGRSVGVAIERRPPAFHDAAFRTHHGPMAAREPVTCTGCHVRADCLGCHRPDAGAAPGYHPAGFLARHPAAAYGRETSCSDCHNVGTFCAACHKASGLVSSGPLRPGYHDANNFFIAGHGQAARQNLESCTACHVERDCLTCHSALGGRRFDPHGPGFDAERLRRKNPQMCTVCHGTAIPKTP